MRFLGKRIPCYAVQFCNTTCAGNVGHRCLSTIHIFEYEWI